MMFALERDWSHELREYMKEAVDTLDLKTKTGRMKLRNM